MKRMILGIVLIALLPAAAAEARRTHVRIYNDAPAQEPARAMPLAVVPPFAMAIDLIRRTSCDPTIAVATGPDDPGFTSHPVGNYLIPAIYRSECGAQPKR
jgi:hypothetical protein